MERYILIGTITKIELKQNNNGDGNYLLISIQYKNVWTDRNGIRQSQMISKNVLTSNSKILQDYSEGLLAPNDTIQVIGTAKATTYKNSSGETKATINITPLTIDNLSYVFKTDEELNIQK